VVPAPFSRQDAVDPEEAFIAALSSCHMLTFVDMARRAGVASNPTRTRRSG
jgi:organic hydroperoxide reductase OsmC/OhrA